MRLLDYEGRLNWAAATDFRKTCVINSCLCRPICIVRRGCAADRLPGLLIRILPGAWMSLCRECCVLSGRGNCVGQSHLPEKV
jgi:hypothetical protein